MKPIQMVDLVGQYEKIKPEVDAALLDVIAGAAFINGPEVKAFEKELATYLGVKHVIPCGNGTDALQVAMMALGLKPGDEVITVPFTFVATVAAIQYTGARAVFADVEPRTLTMNASALAGLITSRPKAIVPVHLCGQMADMYAVLEVARAPGLTGRDNRANPLAALWQDSTIASEVAQFSGLLPIGASCRYGAAHD